MSKRADGMQKNHRLRAARILVGLFLFCAGMLWAKLPGCAGSESAEGMVLDHGPESAEGMVLDYGSERTEGTYPGRGQMAAGQTELGGGAAEQQNSSGLMMDAEEAGYYVNPDTGYRIYVEDRAGLLTEEQRLELSQAMQRITAYGNAAFLTTDSNAASTESLARSYYRERFGTDSGTVFVIDMDNRNIWIHSDGAVYDVITSAYADTVTDNVYRYASAGDYYECAREAFAEIHALLEGQRIAQPMKYISNALLAMILALLANFGLVICLTRLRRPGENALLANIHRKFRFTKPNAVYTHQTKTYDPVSSGGGSSGGSGGGSSGGGGGGGGSSGGGGGHSF